MDKDYNPLDKNSGTPTVPVSPMRPGGALAEAPDIGEGALAGTPATSIVGGQESGPGKPHQPGVTDRIANFISGGQGSPGSVWRGILSGALTGMTAGASQGRFGSGVAAGATRELQQQQQKFENQRQVTREQGEAQVRAATIAKLNHDIISSSWDLSNRQDTARAEHAAAENKLVQEAQAGGAGAKDLGVVRDANDLVQLHKDNPNLLVDQMRGNIFTAPHFTDVMGANGKPTGEQKYDGVRAFYVPPEYSNAKIDHDIDVPMFKPGEKGAPGTWETQTLKAGTVTNKDAMQLLSKQTSEAAKYDNDTAIAKATALNAKAQADLAKAASSAQDAATLQQQATDNGRALVEGDAAPSQMNKRAKSYDATFAAAEKYSMEKYGRHFNREDAETGYKNTQKTVGEFTTGQEARNITAFNTAIAHLGLLDQAAKELQNGPSPTLNRLANEMSRLTGNPVPATYAAVHAAVTGEVGSVYKKGSPDVALEHKLDQTFNDSQSAAQAHGAIGSTVDLMLGKVDALYNQFTNGTRGRTPQSYGVHLISPESEATIKSFGMKIPDKFSVGASPGSGGAPQAPAGQVAVQIPGEGIGFIAKEQLDAFKKDNPTAKVY